jgi:hypothetical protein
VATLADFDGGSHPVFLGLGRVVGGK